MTAESELAAFLETQSGDVESQGQFTVDSHRAFQKLSRFQLPSQGHWVVKIVQAGVAMGASGIDFQFRRKKLVIEVFHQSPATASDILQDTLTGGLSLEASQQHLVTGLRSIWGRYPEELFWESHRAEGWDRACAVTGEKEEKVEPWSTFRGLKIVVRSRSLPGRFKFLSSRTKQLVDEIATLNQLCWMAPIPVRVDKRLICRPQPQTYVHQTLRVSLVRQGLLSLWMEQTSEDGFLVDLKANKGTEEPSGYFRHEGPPAGTGWFEHRSDSRAGKYRASLLMTHYLTDTGVSSNRVWWLKDGALIGPMDLGGWAGGPLDAYFCGQNLRTDLTGFQPAKADFTLEIDTIVDRLEKIQVEVAQQKVPRTVRKRVAKKLKEAKKKGLGEKIEEFQEDLVTLESMELTVDTLADYLDRLFALSELSGEGLTGAARFLKAYNRFFWRGLDFEGEEARRWWKAVVDYFQQEPGEVGVLEPNAIHARLRLSQLESEKHADTTSMVNEACQSVIAAYAISDAQPSPLMSLCLLEAERWKEGILSENLWETVVDCAETQFATEDEHALAEELRCSSELERLIPDHFKPRLRQLQIQGPCRQGKESSYNILDALKGHWHQVNWLVAGPRTLGSMALGLLGCKLGTVGIYTVAFAAAFSKARLDADLTPFWNERRTQEILQELALPVELRPSWLVTEDSQNSD